MKAPRWVIIAVAAIAAVVLALLLKTLIGGKADHPAEAAQVKIPPKVPMIKVLVAVRELKAGTRIGEDDLTWAEWPLSARSPAYHIKDESDIKAVGQAVQAASPAKPVDSVAKLTQSAVKAGVSALNGDSERDNFVGGVVRETINANEPIIDSKIVKATQGGYLAAKLNPGERAMSVPVSVDSTAGGFILPGDHVDIIVSSDFQSAGGGASRKVAATVLRNIKVLAIDQTLETKKDTPYVVGATATLALTPEQGRYLAQSKASGTQSLMLLSYADVEASARDNDVASNQAVQSVKIFRSDTATEVSVPR